MNCSETVIKILISILKLDIKTNTFNKDTQLLGGIPEFDSMAVISVIETLENNFGILIEDDEISAEIFETIGSLVDFIEKKI